MKRYPNRSMRYPVISVVFNYSQTPWNKNRTLRESVVFPKDANGNSLEDRLAPFFNDYKLNVVDVPRLSLEEIQRFRSDFKLIVGAYYALNSQGTPISADIAVKVEHIEESLRCMREMFDVEIAEITRQQINEFQGEVNMGAGTYLVDQLVNKGREEAKEIWYNKGQEEGQLLKSRETSLRMWAQNMPIDQIADLLAVSPVLVKGWIQESGVKLD